MKYNTEIGFYSGRNWLRWVPPLLLFAIAAAVPLTVALESALHFGGVAIDGPFQLYDALRRIQAGFRPGIDFQFFHGLGMPYLHYPFYRLFGGGLFGSELARQLISTIAYPVIFLALFRAFTRDWRLTWYLTAAALGISQALRLTAMLGPLNGMLGLRSALPTLLPLALFLPGTRRTRTIVTGLMLGAALFLSTEQGLAAMLAYLVVSALMVWRAADRRGQASETAAAVGISVATLVLLLTLVAGPRGAAGALSYNFRVVPMDQYWFFGAPPNVFIPSWGRVVPMMIRAWPIGLAVSLGIACVVVYLRRVSSRTSEASIGISSDRQRTYALAVLALYGLISCSSLLGIFTLAYPQPCWRVVIVLGLLELARTRARWVPATAAIACGWMLVTVRSIPSILLFATPHVVRDHVIGGDGFGITGIWPRTLRDDKAILDARRGPDGKPPTVWSTYAGWLEAREGVFHPSFDYIIHALGPENRARYLGAFKDTKPRLVQTVLPAYSQYEVWIENTNWPFYEHLLQNYAVVATTPWSIFWERQPTPQPAARPIGAGRVEPGSEVVRLPPVPATPGLPATVMTVELDYRTHNALRRLPLIGASPRYLVAIEGAVSQTPVSLNPYDTTMRFPVVALAGATPSLVFQTFSLLPGASFEVKAIRISAVSLDSRDSTWLKGLK